MHAKFLMSLAHLGTASVEEPSVAKRRHSWLLIASLPGHDLFIPWACSLPTCGAKVVRNEKVLWIEECHSLTLQRAVGSRPFPLWDTFCRFPWDLPEENTDSHCLCRPPGEHLCVVPLLRNTHNPVITSCSAPTAFFAEIPILGRPHEQTPLQMTQECCNLQSPHLAWFLPCGPKSCFFLLWSSAPMAHFSKIPA